MMAVDTSQCIFVIEDNHATRRLLEDVLSASNYQCHAFECAEDGLSKASELAPGIIILDINLPGMNGIQAANEFRQIPALKNTVIIGMSAHAMKTEEDIFKSAPFNHFLTKPFSYKVLLTLISSIFRSKELSEAGRFTS